MDEKHQFSEDLKCKFCGITPPKGHWRPNTWLQKHEENCPLNPSLADKQ